jgi:dTDP-glucose pyrophosphorylase
MTDHLQRFLLSTRATLLEALGAIDRGAQEIAFVTDDDGKVVGTVTDGDVRRGLLAGKGLDAAVSSVMNPAFISLPVGTAEDDAVRTMLSRGIKALPVLEPDGRLADLLRLQNLLRIRERPNWALVMAGGRGTRLESLTHAIPKPMLPIGNQPLLERIITHLVSHGIRRIYISVHFMARMIQDHFGDGSRFGCHIEYLHETEPLGSGGCLSLLPEVPKVPVFVMNGDLLTRMHVGRMLDFQDRHGFAATVGVRNYTFTIPFGVVETDGLTIRRLTEKPQVAHTINAGMYAITPELVARVPKNTFFPITNLFERALAEGQSIGAYSIEDEWVDIGVPEEYFSHHQQES